MSVERGDVVKVGSRTTTVLRIESRWGLDCVVVTLQDGQAPHTVPVMNVELVRKREYV